MNNLNTAAFRQVIYMIVAVIIAKIGADAASAEDWTNVVMATLAVVGPLLAALNVNKGEIAVQQSPAAPTGTLEGSSALPTYDVESTALVGGGRHRLEG